MAEGTIRFDEATKILYVTAGDTHLGENYLSTYYKFNNWVVDGDRTNFHVILDVTRFDPLKFARVPGDTASDEGEELYGIENWKTREKGDGKVVLVISRTKGNAPRLTQMYEPDAVVYSIEAAEEFIKTGQLVDIS